MSPILARFVIPQGLHKEILLTSMQVREILFLDLRTLTLAHLEADVYFHLLCGGY